MIADLSLGRAWLLRPMTAADLVSLEVLWQNTIVPESLAKTHVTLQLKGQIEFYSPRDPRAQARLLAILSPLENVVIDQVVPWILAFKMLSPQRRAVFRHALLTAAGFLATAPTPPAW